MTGTGFLHQRMSNAEYETMEVHEKEESIIPLEKFKTEPVYDNTFISSIPFTTPYKIRDPIVLLERCDKIWDTLKLIKNVQGGERTDLPEEESSMEKTQSSYIKYVPILGNDNAALPNFQFSVISTKKVYSCIICGKVYTDKRSWQSHSERVHGYDTRTQRKIDPKHIAQLDEKSTHKKEDPDMMKKEKNNLNKAHSKEDKSKLIRGTSPQFVSPPVECTESAVNTQLLKRKRSMRLRSNSISTYNETVEKEKDNNNSVSCVLCKQFVHDIKKHLTDYHKIECYDFMLKELEKTPDIQESKETSNDECLETSEIKKERSSSRDTRSAVESQSSNRDKRKLNNHTQCNKKQKLSNDNLLESRQCNICLGNYAVSSYYKHLRRHRIRGETKENFHLFRCNYVNSPLRVKQKLAANSNKAAVDNVSNSIDNVSNCGDVSKSLKDEEMKQNVNANLNKDENALNLQKGKSFCNYDTILVHKKHCDIQSSEVTQSNIDVSLEETNQNILPNCSDRDSGIGISITIKKTNNNTYEVIGKDSTEHDILKHLKGRDASSDICDDYIESHDQLCDVLETSKYSENHSILKIESAEEDIEIDIEEDSQSNVYNNNVNASSVKKERNSLHEKNEQIIEKATESSEKTCDVKKGKSRDTLKTNTSKKDNVCPCGIKFETRNALNIHFNKYHQKPPFPCGYCKENFSNSLEWSRHWCSVTEGRSMIDIDTKLRCHYCSTILHTHKKFDEHTKVKHYDSIVPYQCFQCEKRFPNTESRKLHFNAEHETPYCHVCKKSYQYSEKSRHVSYHYGLGYPCHLCKRTYSGKLSLKEHMAKQHPFSKYNVFKIKCTHCNEDLPCRKSWKLHRKHGACKNSLKYVKQSNL